LKFYFSKTFSGWGNSHLVHKYIWLRVTIAFKLNLFEVKLNYKKLKIKYFLITKALLQNVMENLRCVLIQIAMNNKNNADIRFNNCS
jgi:hypothetical protein